MLKSIVNTDNFEKVFSSYDLDKKTAVLKTSDEFDEDSIIFVHDPIHGNWVFCRGILYGENPEHELTVDYAFQLEGKYIFTEGDYDNTTETITPLHAEYNEQTETITIL